MPTPPLYHYTTQAGLLGMAQNKTMWLTNLRYMNDAEEFNYGLNFIRKYIKENYHESLGRRLNNPELNYAEIPAAFSFSLTEQKDLLSQWRGYCPEGGYSVSFDSERLQTFVGSNKLQLARCLYEEDEIAQLIEERIVCMSPEQYLKELKPGSSPSKGMSRMPHELLDRAFRIIPFIKHPSFREEKEWRILNMEHYERRLHELPDVKIRGGNNRFIPYLEYKINDLGGNLIDGAILSPGEPDILAIGSTKLLLQTQKVNSSSIPYRA